VGRVGKYGRVLGEERLDETEFLRLMRDRVQAVVDEEVDRPVERRDYVM